MSEPTPELTKLASAVRSVRKRYGVPSPTGEFDCDVVKEVLRALREPSEGMLFSMGIETISGRAKLIQDQNILDGYYAAIDHVLRESGT